MLVGVAGAGAQMQRVRSGAGVRAAGGAGVAALSEAEISVKVRLTAADGKRRGEVWLSVSGENETGGAGGVARLTMRIPLASTEDVYGESRKCVVGRDGVRAFVFTAGLDERNFVPFAVGAKVKTVRLLVNKYLCRALAAPFDCAGERVRLPGDWSKWRLGATSSVALSSAGPAEMAATAPQVMEINRAFDPGSCPVIAPSDGVCCVSGKETNWHCGGQPAGAGWHQVSGDCFHHETGKACKE